MQPNHDELKRLRRERSLVIIKPDGVVRHLVGEVLSRFERKGLKLVAMKLVHPTKAQVEAHYEDNEDWYQATGTRTLESYQAKGEDPGLTAREIAVEVRRKLMGYLGAGPAVVMVLEGPHVLEVVRKMRGATSPLNAEVGTIGFDYTLESYALADAGGWAIRNIIHGSDSAAAAEREIGLWFKSDEIIDYSTALDAIIFGTDWHMNPKGEA